MAKQKLSKKELAAEVEACRVRLERVYRGSREVTIKAAEAAYFKAADRLMRVSKTCVLVCPKRPVGPKKGPTKEWQKTLDEIAAWPD